MGRPLSTRTGPALVTGPSAGRANDAGRYRRSKGRPGWGKRLLAVRRTGHGSGRRPLGKAAAPPTASPITNRSPDRAGRGGPRELLRPARGERDRGSLGGNLQNILLQNTVQRPQKVPQCSLPQTVPSEALQNAGRRPQESDIYDNFGPLGVTVEAWAGSWSGDGSRRGRPGS